MLRKSNKNSGMSLIEVIVSMLVLSIAVVAVTMSFSAASKINMGSKQKQAVESLMENLVEYAEAGGTDYKGWFLDDPSNYLLEQEFSDVAPVSTVRKELLKSISQGLYAYDVRVTTDRAPAKYDTAELNNFNVIQFGGSGSNSVLIDASLASNDREVPPSGVSDYDETAYEYFYTLHSSAVLEHNMIEDQKKLNNPAYVKDEWDLTEEADIPKIVDRELWLEVTKPATDKMQLTAYLTYMFAMTSAEDDVHLPDGTSKTYQIPIFVSDMYDLPSDADADAKKLDQIYVLFTEAKSEEAGYYKNRDIRILDSAISGERALDAKIFLIYQETSSKDVNDAFVIEELENRAETYTIRVACSDVETGVDRSPAGAMIYCSSKIDLESGTTNVSYEEDNLVASNEEVRIVTTTLEILEAGTTKVLASKTVTNLQ